MITLTSGIDIENTAIEFNIKKIINQVYKLLPMREEGRDWEKPLETLIEELSGMKRLIIGRDWEKPLETLIEELSGMKRLIIGQDDLFFLILCKMEGLFSLQRREDMSIYRRSIFECLGLLSDLEKNVCIR